MRRLILIQILVLFFFLMKHAHGSPYIEAGTSVGKASSADPIAGKALGSLGTGFVGSLSLYIPVTPMKSFIRFDLGLQNRFTTLPGSASSLTLVTPNLAARVEFWRFYVGAGYAPAVLVDFKPLQGATAYFGEAGVIWRVVPEFQICGTVAAEYGRLSSGVLSPSPSMEYGLRFRFPLFPVESASGGGGVDFDGFRYPFGIMK